MPSLSFKAQFAAKVADGSKPHTVRAWRKRPFAPGDDLSFFTGMRTKQCRRLRRNARCIAASPIEVNPGHRYVILQAAENSRYYVPNAVNRRLPDSVVEALARADGFENVDQFFAFFADQHGRIVCGQLVEWRP